MAIVPPSSNLRNRICNALGLAHAKSVTINMAVNDVMTVDAWFMPTVEQAEGVAAELEHKRYTVVEHSDAAAH